MRTTNSCVTALPLGGRTKLRIPEDPNLAELIREPWTLRVGARPLTVRTSSARDLAALARMHTRCSPRALLDRYRAGGRPPAVAAMDRALRGPYSVVAVAADADVVAHGMLSFDGAHNDRCVEVGLLVENGWQRMGIGTELISHLAGMAHVAGYHELISYPATAVPAVQRLMIEIGRTRMVPDADSHLHTYLPESASLGLGSVRQRLAG